MARKPVVEHDSPQNKGMGLVCSQQATQPSDQTLNCVHMLYTRLSYL